MNQLYEQPVNGTTEKQKSKGVRIWRWIFLLFRVLLVCALLAGLLLIFGETNFLGYLNPAVRFEPFPTNQTSSMEKALAYIQETPLKNGATLEKWTSPIKLRFEGAYSDKDVSALNKIITSFNSVKGFPGIQLVDKDENVLLTYVNTSEEIQKYQQLYEGDGKETSFCKHYAKDGAIYKAAIVIYCNGFQGYRNSTVLHEFTHLVGFYNHTQLRDSILNTQGPVASLSATDLLAFELYYNPDIKPGASIETLQSYYSKTDIADFQTVSGVAGKQHYPLALLITGAFSGFVLLLIYFPIRRSKQVRLQLLKLLVALFICFLFFYLLPSFLPEKWIAVITF